MGINNSVSGSYDNQDRLLEYGGNTYRYSANGELQEKTNTEIYNAGYQIQQVTKHFMRVANVSLEVDFGEASAQISTNPDSLASINGLGVERTVNYKGEANVGYNGGVHHR